MSWDKVVNKPLWRNWLARSAVNRKAGGSSPPRGVKIKIEVYMTCFSNFIHSLDILPYYWRFQMSWTLFCLGFFKKGHYDYNQSC